MRVPFESLPDSSRVWVFGVQRDLAEDEAARLLEAVDEFLDGWAAHGTPLMGAREWRHGRLLLVGVDEEAAPPSGCSIDALTHVLKDLEGALGTRIVDNAPVWFLGSGGVHHASRPEFARMAREGSVTPATVVFDNTVTRLGQVRAGEWECPAGDSWHQRAFFS
jgi:hypothetical protein